MDLIDTEDMDMGQDVAIFFNHKSKKKIIVIVINNHECEKLKLINNLNLKLIIYLIIIL